MMQRDLVMEVPAAGAVSAAQRSQHVETSEPPAPMVETVVSAEREAQDSDRDTAAVRAETEDMGEKASPTVVKQPT